MYAYPVAVFKDLGSDYGTVVADMPGCCSAGSTLSEALAQTRGAIYTHIESMAKDGEVGNRFGRSFNATTKENERQ